VADDGHSPTRDDDVDDDTEPRTPRSPRCGQQEIPSTTRATVTCCNVDVTEPARTHPDDRRTDGRDHQHIAGRSTATT
jgi:hypothetical protein